ncbi:MAG: anti-sigma factor antagonist, partial [Spirochaetia bacterium]|nr:anti-sigma factor antagonist [Spirochaetia bacterium]
MGNYYFAKDGNKVYFKLTGVLKYTTCGHFDAFLDDFIAHASDVESITIDLTEAEFLDSTNLGFLAKIA